MMYMLSNAITAKVMTKCKILRPGRNMVKRMAQKMSLLTDARNPPPIVKSFLVKHA